MALESIEIDATEKECSRLPKDHPARQGLTYAVESFSTMKRGINKLQGYVYLGMWRIGGKVKSNMFVGVLADLSLKGVSYTYRGLVLNLGTLSLMCQVQWLNHTSVQLYSRTVYEHTIKIVDKKPTWSSSRSNLPPSPSDFYGHHWDVLPALAGWMLNRLNSERNGLASEVIRDANQIFLGVGVYTVVGLFFLAGLSPVLAEAELFNSPLRVARLSGRYFEFLHKPCMDLWKLLRPTLKDGQLAPAGCQRLGYINWLHVYAKDRTEILVRMAELVDYYVTHSFTDVVSFHEERVYGIIGSVHGGWDTTRAM
ncbi:hypothetical protein B0H14DRAFT_3618635 [Mycena olivaceomarginata]|nr:hypothetical protein B0H14DRAFT_3618635 [Mycena olivaceomarginata]